jgi:SAM-dependent methyltransferase
MTVAVDLNLNHPPDELLHWDRMAIPVDAGTLRDLSTFFEMELPVCQERLDRYRMSEMAEEWHKANPRTPEDMRHFYQETELYIWELSKWHASRSHDEYKRRVTRAIELFPPTTHPRVLDYGAGIATASLEFAKAGYDVTIADVPGKTQAFAKHRFKRRGLDCSVLEVTKDIPALPREYDIVVSFDVLEHLPDAERVLRLLVSALRVGGAALIVAAFADPGDHPQHLLSNRERFSRVPWEWALAGVGLRDTPDKILIKASLLWAAPRKLRWSLQSSFPKLPWQFLYRHNAWYSPG